MPPGLISPKSAAAQETSPVTLIPVTTSAPAFAPPTKPVVVLPLR
jgi:hypothetical protein